MALSSLFLALTCIALVVSPVQADESLGAMQPSSTGNLSNALTHASASLTKNPKDAQTRFLNGLSLADHGKTDDAIALFTGLTEDYPELPEPYNNLAVLYASQNKLTAARNALEMAIHAYPGYATAYENLGDLYTKMASAAYDKALALDGNNAALQTKLTRMQEVAGAQPFKPAASTLIPITPAVVQ